MEKLSAALREVSKENLAIPIQNADKDVLAKYDDLTFQDFMWKFGTVPAAIGDMFAKDMFGAGSADVSAYMGLLYIMDISSRTGIPGREAWASCRRRWRRNSGRAWRPALSSSPPPNRRTESRFPT